MLNPLTHHDIGETIAAGGIVYYFLTLAARSEAVRALALRGAALAGLRGRQPLPMRCGPGAGATAQPAGSAVCGCGSAASRRRPPWCGMRISARRRRRRPRSSRSSNSAVLERASSRHTAVQKLSRHQLQVLVCSFHIHIDTVAALEMKTEPLTERFVQQSIVKGVCVALCSQQRRDAQMRPEDDDSAAPDLFSIIIGRDYMVRNRIAENSGLHGFVATTLVQYIYICQ